MKFTHALTRANGISKEACGLVNAMLDNLFPGSTRAFTITELTHHIGTSQRHGTVYVTGQGDQTGIKIVVQPSDNGTAILAVIREDDVLDQAKVWNPIIEKLKPQKGVWRPRESEPATPAETALAHLSHARVGGNKTCETWKRFLVEIPEHLGFSYFALVEAQQALGKSFRLTKDETADVLRLLTEAGCLEKKEDEWRLTETGVAKVKTLKSPVPNAARIAELRGQIASAENKLRNLRLELSLRQ